MRRCEFRAMQVRFCEESMNYKTARSPGIGRDDTLGRACAVQVERPHQ